MFPAGIYLLKVNNRNTRTRNENMFKVNNKDNRTTPMAYFTTCSNVSVVNFEKVNAGWVIWEYKECVNDLSDVSCEWYVRVKKL